MSKKAAIIIGAVTSTASICGVFAFIVHRISKSFEGLRFNLALGNE
jgi:nitrate reductase gamma subunit